MTDKNNIINPPAPFWKRNKKDKNRGTPMAPDFKKGFEFNNTSLWKPTFKERLMVCLGFNVLIRAKVISEKHPGQLAIGVFASITKVVDPKDKSNIVDRTEENLQKEDS